ncbi:hypothetical protein Dsin_032936 [Dipteronia sinensis]|uniref:Uncharacterized protein n=1 Tax=Dipteronia sinensis TaxID=43782 RepID=A0AAD9ZHM9_9ROSI|nr:hypothetical protein Dsin_032936 [Dipteronia sinensis]
MSHSHSMGFSASPPPSPVRSPDYSHYFKSTGELFRKYPLPKDASKSKSHSSTASSSCSRKDKGPDHCKPAFYASPRSSPSTTVASDSIFVSSSRSHSSTGSPFLLSSSPDMPDPTQAFMASRAEPSDRTYDSPGDSSTGPTGPTPIVEEPPDVPPAPPAPAPKSRPTNGSWFQLDDSSPDTWRKKISEISPWLDLQMAKSEQTLEAILREFVSRFTGSLRDWYQALGEYRQLQFVRAQSTAYAMGILFREFLGYPDQYYKQARQEFFDMRCCSLKKKNVEYHYKRMSS